MYIAHQAPPAMGFSRQEYWSGVAMSFSRGSSRPRDRTQVLCIAGRRFYPLSHQGRPVNKGRCLFEMSYFSLYFSSKRDKDNQKVVYVCVTPVAMEFLDFQTI